VVQFVPLKVETDGEDWGKWAREYPHEGNSIPIIYIIRADGQKMYGRSGGLPGDALPQLMSQQLAQAGRIFNDHEFALLEKSLASANKTLADGDAHAAVKTITGIRKLGPLGNLGSFAKAAIEADALVKKLTEQGKTRLDEAKQKIAAGNPPFEAVLALAETDRVYSLLPDLKNELSAAVRDLRKDAALRTTLEQAEALDKAKGLLSPSGGKTRAAGALKQIVARWPDTPAARLAAEQLEKIAPGALAGDAGQVKTPASGASGSNPAAAEKKAASYLSMAKTFAARQPEKAREYAQKVIEAAPDSKQAREAQGLLDRLR
jgi:tetratricopeptide (TPR) repeat protein